MRRFFRLPPVNPKTVEQLECSRKDNLTATPSSDCVQGDCDLKAHLG